MLEIVTLGGLSLRCRGEAVTGFASRKVEALLVFLACTGRPRAREVLAELLWEERSQSQALSNLRVALSSLRSHLAPYLLVTRDAVALNPEAAIWLDAAELGRQMDALRVAKDPLSQAMVSELKTVVALYRGDFLEGFYLRDCSGFENWMVLERERLRAVYEQLADRLLSALLGQEAWHDVIEWGERWIGQGQSPEPAYRAVMQAHGRLGNLAAVQAVYKSCAESLLTDLGVEPSPQTRQLFQDLLWGRAPAPATRAQPDLQAPAADASARDLLRRAQEQGRETLDLPSLAVVYSSQADLGLGADEIGLLVRSALAHGLDVGPWLERAPSPHAAVQALAGAWERHPRPRARREIVAALARLPGDEAADALMSIARGDELLEIRTQAALAAAGLGRRQEVAEALVADLDTPREPGAFATLVAVADEHGLPEGLRGYPRRAVGAAVARRRWRAQRGPILRQAARASLGGAVAWALFGLATPLFTLLADPEDFYATTRELLSLPAWMLAGALVGGVVGAALCWVLGAAAGLADALYKPSLRPRLVAGALAGLAYAFYLAWFSAAGAYTPTADPATYVPVYLVFGMLQGAISTLAVPPLGSRATLRRQLLRSLAAGLAAAAVTVPYVYLVYRQEAAMSLPSRLLNAFLLMCGLGLALVSPGSIQKPVATETGAATPAISRRTGG